jgi:RNA polymerase sigma factor (sigma-70 family)
MIAPDEPSALAARARAGDRAALEDLMARVMPKVYGLAVRMLWDVEDARDASQEILIRIITNLSTFRGDSAFLTWVYRVAANYLLTFRKTQMERRHITFPLFGEDLGKGLEDTAVRRPEDSLLLEELRIGCTMAMLACLDRNHRLAYIVGEVFELGHKEAAEILEISPTVFRKRVSRARARIVEFMQGNCGIVNEANRCRCHRRLTAALQMRRVSPDKHHFAGDEAMARRFPSVAADIRRLELAQRAAALYQAQHECVPGELIAAVRQLLARFDASPHGGDPGPVERH